MRSGANILLVEDNAEIRDLLRRILVSAGYGVQCFESAEALIDSLPGSVSAVSLAILDVRLPGKSGLELCARLGLQNPDLPILMVSALGEPQHRVQGLKHGADDYLAKPFNIEELLLRVEKLLARKNRGRPLEQDVFRWEGGEIDFSKLELRARGQTIFLSPREANLLRLLTQNRNQPVSRDRILASAWGEEKFPTPRTVDNFIVRLRRWVEPSSRSPKYIHSVRGLGYKFTP